MQHLSAFLVFCFAGALILGLAFGGLAFIANNYAAKRQKTWLNKALADERDERVATKEELDSIHGDLV